jgi:phosphoribosyl 1,2-cyclic phosphodiesterase
MGLRICTLGSGSSGNSTYVASGRTALLIDAGLSARETERRLGLLGVPLSGIQGICLTHEHSDHIAGLDVLHRRHGVPLYANSGTVEAMSADPKARTLAWRVFSNGTPFAIGDLDLDPFSVPHDAYDPVGFVVRCGECKAGIVTDVGTITALVRERLRDCEAIVIEANHEEDLLKAARRPWSLKQRILGRHGHLSNLHAAELIAAVAGPRLRHVLLAHLSADCNRPELALDRATAALRDRGFPEIAVAIAPRDTVSALWESR